MKLRTALNVIPEPKYKVTATRKNQDGSTGYEFLLIDYIGQAAWEFARAKARLEELCKMKNKVTFITWNSAAQCIEIDVDVEG